MIIGIWFFVDPIWVKEKIAHIRILSSGWMNCLDYGVGDRNVEVV